MHLFVDNLTNVDFSYLDPERGLVGETWLASIVLEGALDEQGMVCDFGIVKKMVRQWLDSVIDHCLLVPANSHQLKHHLSDASVELTWQYSTSQPYSINCCSPKESITLIDNSVITPQTVSSWCSEQLRTLLPNTIDRITLSFTPEKIEHHFYHYSHGLKKHQGNCQRIAHGHRSTIEIYRNNQRDHQLEQMWCEHWRDIYIGTRDDLIKTSQQDGADYYHFAYCAQQGEFTLTLPALHCDLIDTDSTVEFIAQHIAQSLHQQEPSVEFTVKAFEGIGKGAIAFAKNKALNN